MNHPKQESKWGIFGQLVAAVGVIVAVVGLIFGIKAFFRDTAKSDNENARILAAQAPVLEFQTATFFQDLESGDYVYLNVPVKQVSGDAIKHFDVKFWTNLVPDPEKPFQHMLLADHAAPSPLKHPGLNDVIPSGSATGGDIVTFKLVGFPNQLNTDVLCNPNEAGKPVLGIKVALHYVTTTNNEYPGIPQCFEFAVNQSRPSAATNCSRPIAGVELVPKQCADTQ